MSEKKDEELVKEFVGGNKAVFEVLFNRYYKKVYNLSLRFCNLDASLAEECTQETFLQVYKSLQRFQFKSSFYTWLYRVNFNTCSIIIKKQARLKSHSFDEIEDQGTSPKLESPTETPSDFVLRKEYQQYVTEVLKDLPEEQKQVMLLGPVLGHSYKEISDIIGESVTVIKGRLFRARQNFKKKFEKIFKGDNFPETDNTKK